MLKATITRETRVAAIDGTTLEPRGRSVHYTLRAGIKSSYRKNIKLSVFVDTRSKKILSARIRKKVVHDIKDVKYLIENSPIKPHMIVADKGYDAEWFRAFLADQEIRHCIPTRGPVRRGYHRKRERHDQRTYRRRPIVESSIYRLKQLYGRSVNCVTARNMRAEVLLRIILYNLSLIFNTI